MSGTREILQRMLQPTAYERGVYDGWRGLDKSDSPFVKGSPSHKEYVAGMAIGKLRKTS